MRILIAFSVILTNSVVVYAQNTFPASGNVGIGTTIPTDKLHVVGRIQVDSSATDGFIQTKADNSHIRFGRANGLIGNLVGYRPDVSPGNFVFYSYSGDWIFCNGNIGVGTTSPTAKIDVEGGSAVASGGFYNDATNQTGMNTPGSGTLSFRSGNVDNRMVILGNGNVGIGTGSPNARLDITNNGDGTVGLGVLGGGNTSPTAVYTTKYPNIATSGTNYIRNIGFYSWLLPIASGVTESGYRIGLDIENFVADPSFQGTLNMQLGLWARVGSNSGGTGTIVNSYGVFIDNLDGPATVLNKYGLYQQNSTAKNYFAGNVGIGTTNPTEKLSVNGRIRAREVVVETSNWSDYVFAKDYKLTPLSEVEQHIEKEGHLPGVPSAQDVKDKGVSVGDMQAVLLAKIEELTLHQIEQEKRLNAQAAKITALESENAQLKSQPK